MFSISQILFYAQVAVSVILVVLIAVQQRSSALGAGFGGSGGGGEFYSSRRGLQKNLHYATIAVAALFIILGILNILI